MLPQSDDQAPKPSQEDAAPNPSGTGPATFTKQPASAAEADPDLKSPRGHPFPIVGIGASAGGLEAVTQLLRALPSDTGMAYVLVQHLDPDHKSQLGELLASATPMPVHTVKDRMRIQANQVYVIPPDATMILEDGSLRLTQRQRGFHLPIDTFFESLARVQRSGAIGIVLSGNASDGSHGILNVKDAGGVTFAQDEASAAYIGMPRNAVATGAVDFVLPPADIAEELLRIAKHPYVAPPSEASEEEGLPEGDGELKKIFRLLQNHTKIDFSNYKQLPLRRRLGRRMLVLRLNELADYRRYVEEHPSELKQLYGDLLIGVTSFFRDPEAFEAAKRLLGAYLARRKTNEPVRVWAPGCATGEELYTLAICVYELLQDMHLPAAMQLFGTDINEAGLERARAGLYSDAIAQDVSPERLRRFFVRLETGYQISKSIRESCVFARQDLTRDPPFSHLDLVSCRNVLIYYKHDSTAANPAHLPLQSESGWSAAAGQRRKRRRHARSVRCGRQAIPHLLAEGCRKQVHLGVSARASRLRAGSLRQDPGDAQRGRTAEENRPHHSKQIFTGCGGCGHSTADPPFSRPHQHVPGPCAWGSQLELAADGAGGAGAAFA